MKLITNDGKTLDLIQVDLSDPDTETYYGSYDEREYYLEVFPSLVFIRDLDQVKDLELQHQLSDLVGTHQYVPPGRMD